MFRMRQCEGGRGVVELPVRMGRSVSNEAVWGRESGGRATSEDG